MIHAENVSKNFGENEVLKDLNLTIPDGSIFGLVGVNGAGKSTLLRMIAGVYSCDEGEILLDGIDTFREPAVRKKIAFVSDEPYYPQRSTIRSYGNLYRSLYDFDEDAFARYLKVFDLSEDMVINNLSKGMRRRCAILFALSIHPKALLLDEAYDGLEPIARLHLKQILADLVEDEDIIVVISSHNLKELEDICDTYGILEDGKITMSGDLITARENVNKYQVAFAEDKTKEDFDGLDVLRYKAEGRVIQLVIRGDRDAVTESLRAMDPLILDVLPVNFEELFIYEVEKGGEDHE